MAKPPKKTVTIVAPNDKEELVPVGEAERNWRGVLIALLVILVVLGLILASTLALSPPDRGPRATAPKISLEHLTSGEFNWRNNASWISDYEISYRDSYGGISIFNVEDGSTLEFLKNSTFRMLNAVDYRISADMKFIVFISDLRKVNTHTTDGIYRMVERESLVRYALGPKDSNFEETTYRVQRFQFSPVGNSFAFVYQSDLYFSGSSKKREPRRLTFTGSRKVYNGYPDWLYQEEIFKDDIGFWFSPNSSYLVYAVFNDTLVNDISIPTFVRPPDSLVTISYPKPEDGTYVLKPVAKLKAYNRRTISPGTPNPVVTLYLVDLRNGNFTTKQLSSPKSFDTSFGYLLKVYWSSEVQLEAVWMTRGQNASIYMTCVAPEFNCTKTYSSRGSGEDDLVPLNPRQWRWSLAPLALHGTIDGHVYFEASPSGRVNERHLYRISESSNLEECLTCPFNRTERNATSPPFRTEDCIYTKAKFSTNGKYYMLECLGPDVPTVHIIETYSNLKIHLFENNTDLRIKYDSLSIPQIKIFHIETDLGEKATVRLQMPAGLTMGEDMTFPLVVKLSYKPGEVCVTSKWGMDFLSYLASNKNFLVLEVQPSSRRHDIAEHLAVIKYIVDMDFVDPRKTAILASGYGGSITPAILAEKPEMFSSAVIVSGIFSWSDYNSLWAERYSLEGDVTSKVKSIQNHKLLLIHGTLDLSAHYHQAMVFSKALIDAGILYSHIAYPDVDSNFEGFEKHLYTSIENFLERTLEPIDYTEWETGSSYFSFRN